MTEFHSDQQMPQSRLVDTNTPTTFPKSLPGKETSFLDVQGIALCEYEEIMIAFILQANQAPTIANQLHPLLAIFAMSSDSLHTTRTDHLH